MRVLINFPFALHYKTKAKFLAAFNCSYATEGVINDNRDATYACVFEGSPSKVIKLIVDLPNHLTAYVSFWKFDEVILDDTKMGYNYLADINKCSHELTPRTIRGYGGYTID